MKSHRSNLEMTVGGSNSNSNSKEYTNYTTLTFSLFVGVIHNAKVIILIPK